MDQWLAQRKLNPFGDPPDTVYSGGSPLFDERTGQTADRLEHVFRKHPQAREHCELSAQ